MEWTQPTTAPKQPEIEGDPSVDAGVRVDRHPWIEGQATTRQRVRAYNRTRRPSAMDILSAVMVIALVIAVVVALPLFLLGVL